MLPPARLPRRAWVVSAIAAWLFATPHAHAAGLAVGGVELTDDGDHDGDADTNETVEIRLKLRNTGVSFTGVTARLSSAPGRAICLIDGSASSGTSPRTSRARASGCSRCRTSSGSPWSPDPAAEAPPFGHGPE